MIMKKKRIVYQTLKDVLAWGWLLALVEVFIAFTVFNPNDGLANLGNALHYAEIDAGRIGGTALGAYIGPTLPNYQDQLFALRFQIIFGAIGLFLFLTVLFLLAFGLTIFFIRTSSQLLRALE